jgi:hypothetical protein
MPSSSSSSQSEVIVGNDYVSMEASSVDSSDSVSESESSSDDAEFPEDPCAPPQKGLAFFYVVSATDPR